MMKTLLSRPAGPAAAFVRRQWRLLPPGVWLALGVVAAVGGRWLQLHARRPAHAQAIINAYGGVRLFYGAPQVSHQGGQLTYVATDDHGFALFLCDAQTGRRRAVCRQELPEPTDAGYTLRPGPWSPDDRAFIYFARDQLFVCPVAGGRPAARLDQPQVTETAWLSPRRFAYVANGRNLGCATLQADGRWQPRLMLTEAGPISGLTTLEHGVIGWLAQGRVHRLRPDALLRLHFDQLFDHTTVYFNGRQISGAGGARGSVDLILNPAWVAAGPNDLTLAVSDPAGARAQPGPVTLQTGLEPAAAPRRVASAWSRLPLGSAAGQAPPVRAWFRATLQPLADDLAAHGITVGPPPPDAPSALVQAGPPPDGLVLDLDAAALSQAGQTAATRLADASASGNVALAAGPPPRIGWPGAPQALNGRAVLCFPAPLANAAASTLTTRDPLSRADGRTYSLFAVLRPAAPAGFGLWHPAGRGAASEPWLAPLPATAARPGLDRWDLWETLDDGDSRHDYVDGKFAGKADSPPPAADGRLRIGGGPGSPAAGGDFAELLVYDHALADAGRQQVEGYLTAKWFGLNPQAAGDASGWIDPPAGQVAGFAYRPATGRLLLACKSYSRVSFWRLDTGAGTPPRRLCAGLPPWLTQPAWLDDTTFCRYNADPRHPGLTLCDLAGQATAPCYCPGGLRWFQTVPALKQIYLLGCRADEPAPQIWSYDPAAGAARPLAPCTDQPSPWAPRRDPFHWSAHLPDGRTLGCTVYPPSGLDRRARHPLVLGDTMFGVAVNGAHGRLWVPALAAAGAVVVIIDRNAWFAGLDQWQANVQGVLQVLRQDPAIDPARIYLFAASAETGELSRCLEATPGRFRGALLLNPSALPDFSRSPAWQTRPRILISAGGDEGEEERLKDFQARALGQGVLVDYVIHPGERHHLVGNLAQLQRTAALIHFVFED